MTKFKVPAKLLWMAAIAGAVLGMVAGPGSNEAKAQKLPTASAPGVSITVGGTYGAFQTQYPQHLLGGVGVYTDLNIRHWIGIEGEARFLRQNEIAGSNQTTLLAGPRIELHRGIFSPYAKALVGDGKLQFPYGYGYGNYLVVAGGAGLDVQVSENWKVRLIDFEYQDWPQFNFGVPGTTNPIYPYGVSAGISYRVWHAGGWKKKKYYR